MKPLLIAAISLTALPLFAADAQKATTDAQAQPATTTAAPATTTSAPAAAAPVPDSPLVRAAKATAQANKTNKKKAKIVITNDNLKKAGPGGDGFTTTKSQAPLPPLPPQQPLPTEEQLIAQRKYQEQQAKAAADRAANEAKAKKTAADRKERAAAAVEGDDGDPESLYDDPAATEHRADDANKPKQQDQKPPM